MTAAFSVYLDVVRFLAALAVFLDHLSYPFSKNLLNWRLGRYGNVAVMIFFLLSGYVIAYVAATREQTARDYTIARVARLYSVVSIALLTTFIFDAVGMQINPHLYMDTDILPAPENWAGYLSSLTFVNQYQFFGHWGIPPGSNQPFWSLSFEATYYLVAGLVMFAPRRYSCAIAIMILALAGVHIAMLLPIWVMGYFLYHTRERLKIGNWLALLVFPLSLVLIYNAPTLFPRNPDNYDLYQDYMVAFAFCLNLISARQLLTARFSISERIKTQARWLGTLTFPLYAFHFPVLALLTAMSPWPRSSWTNLLLVAPAALILIALITPVCEWLRRSLHRWLNQRTSARATRQRVGTAV